MISLGGKFGKFMEAIEDFAPRAMANFSGNFEDLKLTQAEREYAHERIRIQIADAEKVVKEDDGYADIAKERIEQLKKYAQKIK